MFLLYFIVLLCLLCCRSENIKLLFSDAHIKKALVLSHWQQVKSAIIL